MRTRRWRYGRDVPATGGRTLHYPPVVTTRTTRPISARYLAEDERIAKSRTCDGQVRQCGPSRRSWGAARRRLAVSCGVTPMQPAVIGRRVRIEQPSSGAPAQGRNESTGTQPCGTGYSSCWRHVGARNRSAVRCASSMPMTRLGSWSPSRSIKPSMTRAAAWSATARARRCALVDDVADHTDDRTRADVGSWCR